MKIIICLMMVVYVTGEPPVDHRYLPPQGFSRSFSAPSQEYGAPNTGFGNGRQANAFRRPSANYGPPSKMPQNNYLPPTRRTNLARVQQSYLSPTNQYVTPSGVQPPFANQYQPATKYTPNGMQAPSQEYGVPGFGTGNDFSRPDITSANFAQSRQYLPPGVGYDGSNGEPANYNFEYRVYDEPSANDFGHREARQGDRAEGVYYVLLPDGRKQTVEYEADRDGYKPRISYEDTGVRTDNRNSQYDQYPSGPY